MYKLQDEYLVYLYFSFSRRNSYSKLLKTARTGQTAQEEPLTNSPSMTVLHQ
jgi:hypothetical protein